MSNRVGDAVCVVVTSALALALATGCGGDHEPTKTSTAGAGGAGTSSGTGGASGAAPGSGGQFAGGGPEAGGASASGSSGGGSGNATDPTDAVRAMCARTKEKCSAVDVEKCTSDKASQIDMAEVAGCTATFVAMTNCGAAAPLTAITCFEDRGDFNPGTCQTELDAYNSCRFK